MGNVEFELVHESSDKCKLIFTSEVEGIATTYANMYRRLLIQNVPCFSIAGMKCCIDGHYVSNLFEVVPGLTGTLLDAQYALHNAVYDIELEDPDCNWFTLTVNASEILNLSELCDTSNINTSKPIKRISLSTPDQQIISIVGNRKLELELFFIRSTGYSPREKNLQNLSNMLGKTFNNKEVSNWMVFDSQHRGVDRVSYHDSKGVGKQIVTLEVTSFIGNIENLVKSCTDNLIKQLSSFKI